MLHQQTNYDTIHMLHQQTNCNTINHNAQDAQEWLFSKEKKYQLGSIVLDGMIAHFLMVTITQP